MAIFGIDDAIVGGVLSLGGGLFGGAMSGAAQRRAQQQNLLKDAAGARASGWFRQPYRPAASEAAPSLGEGLATGALQGAAGALKTVRESEMQRQNAEIQSKWMGILEKAYSTPAMPPMPQQLRPPSLVAPQPPVSPWGLGADTTF